MSKNIWRCRCGKRVEMLTDENFGDCGCSDPVYGPEYFYMSKECADMLDEMDKDYDEQYKHLEEAQAEIENLQWRVSDEQAKAKALLELNDKALELVNEARADAEHWKSECNTLQRMVHEARAEIERLKEYTTCTLESADTNIDDKDVEIIKRDKLIEQMQRAMEKVIANYRVNLRDLTEFENKQVATLEAALKAERGE